MYYKVIDKWGNDRHHFVTVEGCNVAEQQVYDYVEGTNCKVELWNSFQYCPDEKVRDVEIEELKEKVAA